MIGSMSADSEATIVMPISASQVRYQVVKKKIGIDLVKQGKRMKFECPSVHEMKDMININRIL